MSTVSSSTSSPFAAVASSSGSSGSTTAGVAATSAKDASDRFLKLLVTQLQNQDPMNPMDNAQMTSQMAQISTVSGIQQLNTTMAGLSGQFLQLQALQGASLVGKQVILPGDKLATANGAAQGLYQIDSAADNVKVEVLNPAGQLVDSFSEGAQGAGRHSFDWPGANKVADPTGYRFRVTANSGSKTVTSTALMKDTVNAVNTTGSALTLELANSGAVPYSSIQALD